MMADWVKPSGPMTVSTGWRSFTINKPKIPVGSNAYSRPPDIAELAIQVAVHPRKDQFTGVRTPSLAYGVNAHEPS